MNARNLPRRTLLPSREIRLTAYDDAERAYEIVCTVAYGETAGGRLMIVDARLQFDRDDMLIDEKLRRALECAFANDRRDASSDRAEALLCMGDLNV